MFDDRNGIRQEDITRPRPGESVPAQNLEAEEGVIGSILLDNTLYNDVSMVLSADHFFRDSNQVLYRAIRDLILDNVEVDSIALEEALRRGELLEKAGGLDNIFNIIAKTPVSANARYWAQIVIEKAHIRRLTDYAHSLLRDCYSDTHSAEDLQAKAEQSLLGVMEDKGNKGHVSLREVLDGVKQRYEERREGKGFGLRTGIEELDGLLMGLTDQFVILAGRPSMGKTALVQQIVRHVAYPGNVPPQRVYFVSIEMSAQSLGDRFVVSEAEVDGKAFRMAKLKGEDYRKFNEAIDKLAEMPIDIDPGIPRTLEAITWTLRRENMRSRIALVVVDYIQLMDVEGSTRKNDNRQSEVSRISQGLKNLVLEINCPVIALSQLNRQVEGRQDHEPRMSDLRDSGSLEQDADIILFIHRPGYYDDNDTRDLTQLIVAKHRNGPTGSIDLRFDMSKGLFIPYEAR